MLPDKDWHGIGKVRLLFKILKTRVSAIRLCHPGTGRG
jgi:hypothetical protein